MVLGVRGRSVLSEASSSRASKSQGVFLTSLPGLTVRNCDVYRADTVLHTVHEASAQFPPRC